MTDATLLWSIWQALLQSFAWAFTRPGYRRFAEWVTALALNVEEHTITQSVLALERPADWKALESLRRVRRLARRPRHPQPDPPDRDRPPAGLWHGYHVSAVDDTKVHRSGPHVWGTCTFHEYTARCPNRATTVRAHNWVVLGALLREPRQARLVPADLRPALLPQVAVAPAARAAGPHRAVPHQVRAGRRAAPGAGPDRRRAAPGRLRRRLRPAERGPAAGLARGRLAPHRVPDPAAARRPAVRPAADGAAQGKRAEAEVGPAAAAAPPGRPVDQARGTTGDGLRLRPPAEGPLEGGRLPVAGLGARRAGQGGGRPGRGLQEAVHAGHLGGGADRVADGGAVRAPGSARRTGSAT